MIVALWVLYPPSSIALLISERVVGDYEQNRRLYTTGQAGSRENCTIDT